MSNWFANLFGKKECNCEHCHCDHNHEEKPAMAEAQPQSAPEGQQPENNQQ